MKKTTGYILGSAAIVGAIALFFVDFERRVPPTGANSRFSAGTKASALEASTKTEQKNATAHRGSPPQKNNPSIVLRKLDSLPPIPPRIPSIGRSGTISIPGGRTITFKKPRNQKILSILPDTAYSKFLICFAPSLDWGLYDAKGNLIRNLPSASGMAPKAANQASLQWKWWNRDALIAILETYEETDPKNPEYPEHDAIPVNVRLCRYDLESGEIRRLVFPEKDGSSLLRLEGITDNGVLIVSRIPSGGDYWSPRNPNTLSAYAAPK